MRQYVKFILAALTAMVLTFPAQSRGLADKSDNKADVQTDTTARRHKNFINPTVMYRNEIAGGTGLLYTNFSSRNSEFALLANGIGANGNLFRFSPFVEFAYKDNASIGIRGQITTAGAQIDKATASLLSEDLSFSVNDVSARLTSYGAAIFHRNYFGLEKSGTVGLFLECALKYSHNKLDIGGGNYNNVDQLRLGLAPGIILYVLPFVSVEGSIGIADVTASMSRSYKQDRLQGQFGKVKANASLNILNCNFGVAYHF